MINTSYYNWFKKIIAVFIELFFVLALLSSLYLYTYPFNGAIKYIVYIAVLLIFGLVVYLLKNRIKKIINKLLIKLESLDVKKMLIIIVLTMIILKVIYTVFFYFDPTIGDYSDINIYDQIAKNIAENGTFSKREIAHLIGMGFHLAGLRILKIPYHIGMFMNILLGTIINFYSFKSIIGKEKSFIVVMLYTLMPSTMLLTFCPTHELYVYLYFSLFIYLLNSFIKSNKNIISALLALGLYVCAFLASTITPSIYILYIIIALVVILSRIKFNKKIVLCIALTLSVLSSNLLNNYLEVNKTHTTMNTYSILICGSSIETNGEHVDNYPSGKVREYIDSVGLPVITESKLIGYKAVLLEQYKYLLTHPIDMIKLLAHKFYVEWSGNHYSIEMAHTFSSLSDIGYYLMLVLNSIIYLLAITIAVIFNKKKDDDIYISNYKLLLLGIMAMLLISLVLNKYSTYMTIFIYLIAFYRAEFN